MNHSLLTPPLPADPESRTHRAQRIALGVVLGCGVGFVIDYQMTVWLDFLMFVLIFQTFGLVVIAPVVLGGLLGILAARAQRIPPVPWIVIVLVALVVAPLGWSVLDSLWFVYVLGTGPGFS